VVVLSQFAEPAFVLRLFADGSAGLGYLLKDRVDAPELQRAISSVVSGESAVDAKIVEVLIDARSNSDGPVSRLTAREQEVLAAIAEGLNNAAVADMLIISEKAVAKHINSIFSKLDLTGSDDDVHRRVKAVLIWLSQ
jgi:DNA-binding NarL/FixJ family response regulator